MDRRRARRWWVGSLAAVSITCITSFASEARAHPEAKLVYERDATAQDCPDEAALRAAAAERLGYDPFVSSAPNELHASVRRQGGKYRATVKIVDEDKRVSGTREIEHPGARCANLVDAMALTISIAIDPRKALGLPPGPAAEPPPASARPAPPPNEGPRDEDPPPPSVAAAADLSPTVPPRPRRLAPAEKHAELVTGAALAAWFGAAPVPSTGALLFAGVRFAPGALFLEGRADLAASRPLGGAVVTTSFAAGTIAPCAVFRIAFACGALTVGRLHAASRGIAVPREDSALHALAGGRVGVAVPVGSRVEIVVRGDLLSSLTSQTLAIDAADVYALPRWSGGIAAGAQIALF